MVMTANAIAISTPSVNYTGYPNPNFWLPLADAGAGAVSTTLAAGTGSATFTRATTAWTKLASGLWAQVASGTARSCYLGADTTVGAYGGYFAEAAATNLCLQSRDLSNASWTKVNMTAAKDQVGIDGVANSASSITATAGSGTATCLQTITEAATASALSMFIKAITLTGTVTIQQGATTSEISAQLNTNTYTRVELDATVLNPAIGIVLGNNGDKIAVDMVQFENTSGKATSPVPTTTASATRNADVLLYPTSGNVSGTAGTAYCETTWINSTGGADFISAFTPTSGIILNITSGGSVISLNDGTTRSPGPTATTPSLTIQKMATKWAGANCNGYLNGTPGTPAGFSGNLNIGSNVGLMVRPGPSNWPVGTIKNVKIWQSALTDAQIAGLG